MSNNSDRFSRTGFLNRMTLLALGTAGGCGLSQSQPNLPSEDVQFTQASSAAMVAFDNGEVETAAQLYERALARGHAMDDSRLVAEAAYNLAACEITLNRYDAALESPSGSKIQQFQKRAPPRRNSITDGQSRLPARAGRRCPDHGRAALQIGCTHYSFTGSNVC